MVGQGIYIDLVTNVVSAAPFTGWDINPYVNGGSTGSFFGMYLPPGATPLLVKSSARCRASAYADVAKLPLGAPIGPSSSLIGQPSEFGFMNNATVGDWLGAGTGYMGIQFTEAGVNGGNPMYGWVEISRRGAGRPQRRGGPTGITFVDWAYDNNRRDVQRRPDRRARAVLARGACLQVGAVGLSVRRDMRHHQHGNIGGLILTRTS